MGLAERSVSDATARLWRIVCAHSAPRKGGRGFGSASARLRLGRALAGHQQGIGNGIGLARQGRIGKGSRHRLWLGIGSASAHRASAQGVPHQRQSVPHQRQSVPSRLRLDRNQPHTPRQGLVARALSMVAPCRLSLLLFRPAPNGGNKAQKHSENAQTAWRHKIITLPGC